MRILVALGGNALLKRGEPMTADVQRANVRTAARSLAPVAEHHQLVLSHGNGPQVGLLALQAAAYKEVEAYPLDVLGAQTEGMIGYLIEQELGNLLPAEVPFATILTMIEVDADDPAFADPTKFVGPIYDDAEAEALAAEKGWVFKRDGEHLRRVVPSPAPKRIFEIRPIRWLLEHGVVVICAGGGGIPTTWVPGRNARSAASRRSSTRTSPASCWRARSTPTCSSWPPTSTASTSGWGTPEQRRLDRVTPDELRSQHFAAGSMGPKVEAAVRFVEATGKRAAIGALADIEKIVEGSAGTTVVPDADGRGRSDERVRRALRGRQAAQGDGPPTGPEPAAPDAVEPRRAAVRRRAVGRAGPVRARPVRRPHARARRRGVPPRRPARRGAGGERRGAAAAHRARRVRVHRRLVAGRRGPQPARRPQARPARQAPDRRADRRRGRARPRQGRRGLADRRRPRRHRARSCCRRCRTRCSPATRRAGSTAACRSTRCTGRPAAARRTTWRPSTGPTRCSPTPTSSSGTRPRAPTAGSRPPTSGWPRWKAATSCRSATAPC